MRSFLLGGRVVRRIALDSCSASRFADCGERELVARRIRTAGAKLMLPLDVAVEVVATPEASRRRVLLAPLKMLGPALEGAPYVTQVLTDPAMLTSMPEQFLTATGEVRRLLRDGALNADAQAHVDGLRAPRRRQARATNREAFDWFQATSDPSQPVQSLADAARTYARDRSKLRRYRHELIELARADGRLVRRCQARVLRRGAHRWWGVGWVYLARAACTAPSKSKQGGLPGFNDLSLLALMPFCDAFVTDDEGLLQAALSVRGVFDSPVPWIGSFEGLRSALVGDASVCRRPTHR